MKIAFYKAYQPKADLIDKIIAIFSFGRYSHVELIFPNKDCFSISARDKEARFKRIHLNPERWDVYELDSSVNSVKIRKSAKEYIGFKYDFIGALTSIFPVCIQKEKKVFCSEVVTELLKEFEGYEHLSKGCNYSPSRLHKIITKKNKD